MTTVARYDYFQFKLLMFLLLHLISPSLANSIVIAVSNNCVQKFVF
jgi:hypothetical protein